MRFNYENSATCYSFRRKSVNLQVRFKVSRTGSITGKYLKQMTQPRVSCKSPKLDTLVSLCAFYSARGLLASLPEPGNDMSPVTGPGGWKYFRSDLELKLKYQFKVLRIVVKTNLQKSMFHFLMSPLAYSLRVALQQNVWVDFAYRPVFSGQNFILHCNNSEETKNC